MSDAALTRSENPRALHQAGRSLYVSRCQSLIGWIEIPTRCWLPPRLALPADLQGLLKGTTGNRTAARWGVILVLIPALFIGYNVAKYVLAMDMLPDLADMLPHAVRNDLLPLVLLGAGPMALLLNVLAILHVGLDRGVHAWTITLQLKKKPVNLAILAVGSAVSSCSWATPFSRICSHTILSSEHASIALHGPGRTASGRTPRYIADCQEGS
jgi:hypothetical protein